MAFAVVAEAAIVTGILVSSARRVTKHPVDDRPDLNPWHGAPHSGGTCTEVAATARGGSGARRDRLLHRHDVLFVAPPFTVDHDQGRVFGMVYYIHDAETNVEVIVPNKLAVAQHGSNQFQSTCHRWPLQDHGRRRPRNWKHRWWLVPLLGFLQLGQSTAY